MECENACDGGHRALGTECESACDGHRHVPEEECKNVVYGHHRDLEMVFEGVDEACGHHDALGVGNESMNDGGGLSASLRAIGLVL